MLLAIIASPGAMRSHQYGAARSSESADQDGRYGDSRAEGNDDSTTLALPDRSRIQRINQSNTSNPRISSSFVETNIEMRTRGTRHAENSDLERVSTSSPSEELPLRSVASGLFPGNRNILVDGTSFRTLLAVDEYHQRSGLRRLSHTQGNRYHGTFSLTRDQQITLETHSGITESTIDGNSLQQIHQEPLESVASSSESFARTLEVDTDPARQGGRDPTLYHYERYELLESARKRRLLQIHEDASKLRAIEGAATAFRRPYPLLGREATLYHPPMNMNTSHMLADHALFPYHGIISPRGSILPSTHPVFDQDLIGVCASLHRPNLLRHPLFMGATSRVLVDERASISEISNPKFNRSFAGIDYYNDLQPPHNESEKSHSHDEADRKQSIAKGPPTNRATKRKPGARDRRFNSTTPISLVAAARSDGTESLELSGRPPVSMYSEKDLEHLSEYQCYLRQQMEIFEANAEDLQYNAQKMNKAVVLGQVGIRCKHCAHEDPWARTRGAVYYSASLGGLYQAGKSSRV